MRGKGWYGYSRSQALGVIALPKIFTPDIAARPSFSVDESGEFFFTGGVAGGYGILVLPNRSRAYVLGLLNSKLLEWYIRQTATQMRGGYYSYESRFIRRLPIREIESASAEDKLRHERIAGLVEHMLSLQRQLSLARTEHTSTVLHRQIEVVDAQIDRLVYDLYDLSEQDVSIVEEEVMSARQ